MTAMPEQRWATETIAYRVRFDECAPSGVVRPSAYLRYAQDLAWIHSERLGYDRAWYAARSLAWVVRAVELAILEPIGTGESLRVTTRVIGFRRVWGRRRTDVHDAAGRLVAWALTDWVMTDARGRPARVPAEFEAGFGARPDSFLPIKVALPEPSPDALDRRFVVRPQELDPMGHVNNAVYVDWVDEATEPLWAAGLAPAPRRYRLEYLAPVPPAAVLDAAAWRDGPATACRLRDVAGLEALRASLVSEPDRT